MLFKLIAFLCFVAYSKAGDLAYGAPAVAYSSAPAVSYASISTPTIAKIASPVSYAAAPVAYAAPAFTKVAYAAPAVAKVAYSSAPAVSYSSISSPLAAYAHAPVAYAAPTISKYAAPLTYAAPTIAKYAPVAYASPVAKAVYDEPSAPANYDFGYAVNDPHTGDSKNQQESRRGDVVHGSYSLIDSDGTKRTVEYTADPHNGFNAVVHREPLAVKAAPIAYAAPAVAKLAYAPPTHVAIAAPTVTKLAAPAYYH